MESYSFSSQLSYEQLCSRIKLLARPNKLFAFAAPDTYLYEFYGENGFCLIKAPHSCMRDQVAFCGKLIRTPTGTDIVGKFSFSPLYARCIWLFYLIPMLFLLFQKPLFFFIGAPPFLGAVYLLLYVISPSLFPKNREELLSFIRRCLLN